MELHQVRYFIALSRTLNFTRAAEQCNVSQPALTRAIRKLEFELGGDLIHRERQFTQLTDLGKLVSPMLEQAASATENARCHAKLFNDGDIATLRIGLAPTVSPSIVVELLSELTAIIPGLEIALIERPTCQLAEALLGGEIHAAIAGAMVLGSERIARLRLFSERYVVLVAPTHPFAKLSVVPLCLLQQATWLRREGCEVAQRFKEACFPEADMPDVGHRGHQESHLQHMTAAGLGIMLTPEHAPRLPHLVARPIEGDPVYREVELLVMAGRRYTPALDAFLRLMRVQCSSDSTERMSIATGKSAVHRYSRVNDPASRVFR